MLGMGTHLSGLLLLNVPPSPSLCDFSEDVQDSTEDWLRLLVPVPEHTDAARTTFPPSASLSKGLRESPGAQPVRGYSEFWPCQRQIRIFPAPSHIQPMVTSICCVVAARSRVSVGLDGHSPCGYTVDGGRIFTYGMTRVSTRGAGLVVGVRDPRRGLWAETPRAGGGSAYGRVAW